MRHVSEDGIALIKRFESFSASIYTCPAGYPTIGYGHVVKERESREYASGIDEAKLILVLWCHP